MPILLVFHNNIINRSIGISNLKIYWTKNRIKKSKFQRSVCWRWKLYTSTELNKTRNLIRKNTIEYWIMRLFNFQQKIDYYCWRDYLLSIQYIFEARSIYFQWKFSNKKIKISEKNRSKLQNIFYSFFIIFKRNTAEDDGSAKRTIFIGQWPVRLDLSITGLTVTFGVALLTSVYYSFMDRVTQASRESPCIGEKSNNWK